MDLLNFFSQVAGEPVGATPSSPSPDSMSLPPLTALSRESLALRRRVSLPYLSQSQAFLTSNGQSATLLTSPSQPASWLTSGSQSQGLIRLGPYSSTNNALSSQLSQSEESVEFLPSPARLRGSVIKEEEGDIDMDYQNDQHFKASIMLVQCECR